MNVRRLPVYLLLDISESMAGPAIDSVNEGVRAFVKELGANPQTAETVHLSVITFSRDAREVVPLTELMAFRAPKLSVRSGTALGAALRLLVECMRRDVVKTTSTSKGDYKPLVFLLTDGQPTDDWEGAASLFRKGEGGMLANLLAIGCGPDVDIQVLYAVTDHVLLMSDLTPESIQRFFVWLSMSVQSVSVRTYSGGESDSINLPKPPPGINAAPEVPLGDAAPVGGAARQVFLHALCSQTRQPYLMSYVRREYEERYDAVAAHALDFVTEDDAAALPPINASLLVGVPSCPYCDHRHTGVCPCGAVLCTPDPATEVVCPKCNCVLRPGSGGREIEITRSEG